MTVNEVVKQYDEGKAVSNIVHIRQNYLSWSDKVTMCSNIIRVGYTKDEEAGIYRVDNNITALLKTMTMIYSYFDIERENDVRDYDALKESGLLNVLISYIPELEREEFDRIYKTTERDFRDNCLGTASVILNLLNSLKDNLSALQKLDQK